MTKINYLFQNFSSRPLKWMKNQEDSLTTIEYINEMIQDFRDQGYTLNLRQLYYQFVKSDLFKGNDNQTYKNFGGLVTKGRNNGLISWLGIEDRGRGLKNINPDHEEDDDVCIQGISTLLSMDKWKRQPWYFEVWVEKEALAEIVARGCNRRKIPFLATRGYLSASEAWSAGRRFKKQAEDGKKCKIFHLADHDPEGVNMTLDNQKRVSTYARMNIEVDRIGLTLDQVLEYDPPPNYAKETSSRYDAYVDEFGREECWELDALDPSTITELIHDATEPLIDVKSWDWCVNEQRERRGYLAACEDNWHEVKDFLDREGYTD